MLYRNRKKTLRRTSCRFATRQSYVATHFALYCRLGKNIARLARCHNNRDLPSSYAFRAVRQATATKSLRTSGDVAPKWHHVAHISHNAPAKVRTHRYNTLCVTAYRNVTARFVRLRYIAKPRRYAFCMTREPLHFTASYTARTTATAQHVAVRITSTCAAAWDTVTQARFAHKQQRSPTTAVLSLVPTTRGLSFART